MKTFLKVTAIIAGSAIALGLVVILIGFTMGGRWSGVRMLASERIGFAGVSINDSDLGYQFDTEYRTIESLDFDIAYGEVVLEEGTEFSFTGTEIWDEVFDSYIEDGVWHIDYGKDVHWGGWFDRWRYGEFDHSKMVITVPARVLKEITVTVGAGTANLTSVSADEMYLEVGAGSLKGTGLVVRERGTMESGTGEINIKKLEGSNISIESGIGSVNVEGSLQGENSADCGMGEIRLNLSGSEEDYNYSVDAGLGSVSIGGERSFTSTHKSINHDQAKSSFNLSCGIGSIRMSFTE